MKKKSSYDIRNFYFSQITLSFLFPWKVNCSRFIIASWECLIINISVSGSNLQPQPLAHYACGHWRRWCWQFEVIAELRWYKQSRERNWISHRSYRHWIVMIFWGRLWDDAQKVWKPTLSCLNIHVGVALDFLSQTCMGLFLVSSTVSVLLHNTVTEQYQYINLMESLKWAQICLFFDENKHSLIMPCQVNSQRYQCYQGTPVQLLSSNQNVQKVTYDINQMRRTIAPT